MEGGVASKRTVGTQTSATTLTTYSDSCCDGSVISKDPTSPQPVPTPNAKTTLNVSSRTVVFSPNSADAAVALSKLYQHASFGDTSSSISELRPVSCQTSSAGPSAAKEEPSQSLTKASAPPIASTNTQTTTPWNPAMSSQQNRRSSSPHGMYYGYPPRNHANWNAWTPNPGPGMRSAVTPSGVAQAHISTVPQPMQSYCWQMRRYMETSGRVNHYPYPTPSSKPDKPPTTVGCVRRAPAGNTSLVTPTPKKPKLSNSTTNPVAPTVPSQQPPSYSRKNKSLGVLAENFLRKFEHCASGTEIIVDEAAVELGVERRRIYDVVNILESIQLVVKKGKNTYTWLGKKFLYEVFGRMQEQAILEYPQDALEKGLISEMPCRSSNKTENNHVDEKASKDNKSLAKLSQQFLQVFLVGHDVLSLPQASDKIQGATSDEDLAALGSSSSPDELPEGSKEFKKAAARGLKTKIRRLYDIANVFLSVGLLKKRDAGGSHVDSLSNSRRPYFQWNFNLTPKEIKASYTGKKSKETEAHSNTSFTTSSDPSTIAALPGAATRLIAQDDCTPVRSQPIEDTSSALQVSKQAVVAAPWSQFKTPTMPPPPVPATLSSTSSVISTRTDGFAEGESDSSRVIMANIHQSGGAWDHPAQPTTPSLSSRSVTLSQTDQVEVNSLCI